LYQWGAPAQRGAPDLVPCRQPRELVLDGIEFVMEGVEIAAPPIELLQREIAFVMHTPGMPEES